MSGSIDNDIQEEQTEFVLTVAAENQQKYFCYFRRHQRKQIFTAGL